MTGSASAALTFREVDHAAFAAALGRRLRAHDVGVSTHDLLTFVRATAAHPPRSRGSLYWCARLTLVSRHQDLAVFDAVFTAVFDRSTTAVDPHARRRPDHTSAPGDGALTRVRAPSAGETEGAGLPWHTLPSATHREDESDSDTALLERLPSDIDRPADTPFADLDAADLAALGEHLERALRSWPVRHSRRRSHDVRHGTVDLRRTIARAHRSGGDPARLVRARPVTVPRRLVMLCDVSQSMEPYATAYLHLMRTLARGGHAETFAFSTSLTRVTAALQHRSAEAAIDQATARVVDRFGGTRIATNLRALLASRHGNGLRGAIVVIASDGWDTDAPDDLARTMARLHRRAHRTIWLNPRAGFPGYAPRVAAMGAALPYCDAFLPAHTMRGLMEALDVIVRSDTVRRFSSTA